MAPRAHLRLGRVRSSTHRPSCHLPRPLVLLPPTRSLTPVLAGSSPDMRRMCVCHSSHPVSSYTCVPQMHRPTQELAIASISVYSSRAHAFIACVPSVRHTDTTEMCDAASYQSRLWTRAECLTHLLINGTGSMWIASGATPRSVVPMPAEWLKGSAVRCSQSSGSPTKSQRALANARGKPCSQACVALASL